MVSCSTVDGVFDYDLPNILKERVVGTPGHMEVQEVRSLWVDGWEGGKERTIGRGRERGRRKRGRAWRVTLV